MQRKIEALIATTNKQSIDFVDTMNIGFSSITANQHTDFKVEQKENAVMVTTPSKGVGINRNLGLSLSDAEYVFIVDDDMIFYDNASEILNDAINNLPDADVIIFNFDYVKDGAKVRSRIECGKRLSLLNCLQYGICCALIKSSKIQQKNICFTTLFGGGCTYSCGEDSLFYLDCIRNKLKVYTYSVSVGMNQYRESTWFKGYNEKFFYDKGAWIACAFPKIKNIIKWYFVLKFKNRSELSFRKSLRLINRGIKGFEQLRPYTCED